jgi:hypothetical protein
VTSLKLSPKAQLLKRQEALIAKSTRLRQSAKKQTARVLAPLQDANQGMRWLRHSTLGQALLGFTAFSLLFTKTRRWGLQGLRVWRLWRSLRSLFKG